MQQVLVELEKTKDIMCLDVSFFPNTCKRFDVNEIPTTLILKNGMEHKRIVGILSATDIKFILKN